MPTALVATPYAPVGGTFPGASTFPAFSLYPGHGTNPAATAVVPLVLAATPDNSFGFFTEYTVSSLTADADPGVGRMRFNNYNAQELATVLRLDLIQGDTIKDVTALLDAMGSSGTLLIIDWVNASNWMLYDVIGVASPSGYRNVTVAFRRGSGTGVVISAAGFAYCRMQYERL